MWMFHLANWWNKQYFKNNIFVLQDANDSIRIKSKMLEDQTESIRQLKKVSTVYYASERV
jgi:hypothetical protein